MIDDKPIESLVEQPKQDTKIDLITYQPNQNTKPKRKYTKNIITQTKQETKAREYKNKDYKYCCPTCRRTIRTLKKGYKCYKCNIHTNYPLKSFVESKTYKRRSGKIIAPLTLNQIEQHLCNITDFQWKAFFSLLYLSGCRISEIIPYPKKKLEGLKRGQIEINNIEDKQFLVLKNVPILKRQKGIYKNIPIPLHREVPIVSNVLNYINNITDDRVLFPFTQQRIYRESERQFGKTIFPHLLRHFRVSILTSDYGFSEAETVHFIGWSDSRAASTYTHLNWENIAKKM